MGPHPTDFAAWLASLIGEGRKFASIRELATHLGISDTSVRRYLDGAIPSTRVLRQIAAAEPSVNIEYLQRLAGILPQKPDPEKERLLRELENVVSRLPEKDQKFILDMALRMLEGQ